MIVQTVFTRITVCTAAILLLLFAAHAATAQTCTNPMSVSCNASTLTGGSGTTYSFSNTLNITLTMDAAVGTYAQNFNFPNNNLVIDPDGHASTFSGVLSGSSSQIYIADSQSTGSVTFTGTNTFTGNFHIGGPVIATTPGTVYLSGAGSLASATMIINGALDLSGTTSGTSLTNLRSDTGITAGSVNLGGKPLTLTGGSTYAGTVNGTGGSLELKGRSGNNASQTLTGVNTYTGATTIDAPITAGKTNTLTLSGSGSIAASSGVTDNGILDISATTGGTSVTTLSGAGTATLGSKTLTLTNGSSTFSGAIGGTGAVKVSGGTQTLSGTNTYSGATTVGSGATLALASGGTIASTSGIANSGTLQLNGQTVAQIVSGSGTLAAASGTTSLTATNSYTGATTVADGATLVLLSGSSIAATSGVTTTGSGIIDFVGQTFAPVISGSGALASAGGTTTLTSAETNTGGDAIGATATLALSGAGNVASSIVYNAGKFDISATASGASAAGLDDAAGTSSVVLGTKTLTLTAAAGHGYAGKIGGTGALTVAGGSQTLSGANTYTGATTVASGGTLNLTGSLTSSVTVASGGTFSGTGSVGGGHSIANSGTVAPGNGTWGTLTDSGAFTQLATGMLTIDIGGTAASGDYSVLNALGTMTLGGTLDIETVNGYTISGTSGPFDILSAGNGLSGDFSLLMLNGTACSADGTDMWLCGPAELATEVFSSGTVALNFSRTRVPEPASGGLVLAGLAGVGWIRRRATGRSDITGLAPRLHPPRLHPHPAFIHPAFTQPTSSWHSPRRRRCWC